MRDTARKDRLYQPPVRSFSVRRLGPLGPGVSTGTGVEGSGVVSRRPAALVRPQRPLPALGHACTDAAADPGHHRLTGQPPVLATFWTSWPPPHRVNPNGGTTDLSLCAVSSDVTSICRVARGKSQTRESEERNGNGTKPLICLRGTRPFSLKRPQRHDWERDETRPGGCFHPWVGALTCVLLVLSAA